MPAARSCRGADSRRGGSGARVKSVPWLHDLTGPCRHRPRPAARHRHARARRCHLQHHDRRGDLRAPRAHGSRPRCRGSPCLPRVRRGDGARRPLHRRSRQPSPAERRPVRVRRDRARPLRGVLVRRPALARHHTRDGRRAVPRAIALAVTGVGVLYIAVQLVAQGILGSALAAPETAKAPLAAAAVQFAGPTGSTLILTAMVVSTFGFMTATMLATPRTLFAFAVDGYLPRPLARVHPEHHTPHVAIAVQGVIVCAIAITGTYVKLAIMADVAILLVYLACCVGVWRLRRLDAGAAAA